MRRRDFIVGALGATTAIQGSVRAARSNTFPSRQISIVVPFAAGGPSDAMARLIAQGFSEKLGARVLVENVPGAGGTTGSARVARAEPDGHMLLFGNIGTHAANMGLYQSLPYNPETDFEPVALLANVPFIVGVKTALPVKTLSEFRSYASSRPGDLTYGSAGIGSASHLAGLLFDASIGAKARHVPYRGVGPAMNDLVGGQIDFMCDQTVTMAPQVTSGTVRPVAVMSKSRAAVLPDVPTLAEGGLPGAEVEAWNALFAPKGTPRALVDRLFELTWDALNAPAIRARFTDLGAVIPEREAATPSALRGLVASEVKKWVSVLQAAGVTAR